MAKFTIEQFDFSKLTANDVLMVEVKDALPSNFTRIQRLMRELFNKNKIPKGILVLVGTKDQPVKLTTFPEKMMNENGWFKKKIDLKDITMIMETDDALNRLQNGHPESPATESK